MGVQSCYIDVAELKYSDINVLSTSTETGKEVPSLQASL